MSKRKPLTFPGKSATDVEKYHAENKGEKAAADGPPMEGGWDAHYIPGYSDKRRNNELAKVNAEYKPVSLPMDLLWARCTGERDRRNVAPHRRRGFRFLHAEDEEDAERKLSEWGYGFPESGWVDDSGLIRNDDTVLMFRPEGRREREESDIKQYTDKVEGMSSEDNIEMTEEERQKIRVSEEDVIAEG